MTTRYLRIHGDNIVECERTLKLIAEAYNSKYELLDSPVYFPKYSIQTPNCLFVIELLSGHGRWSNIDLGDIIYKSGGKLRESADSYLTEISDNIENVLLGIEYCSEPIKSAGREGQVKIAFCDLSENCQGSLDNGETVCAIGGQYADAVFPFVLINNALEGNALDKVEVPVNFIVCKSGQEFSDYMTYLHNDGVYAWTTDEVDQLIKSKNKNASSDELLEMGKNYSIEDTIARHGK